MAVEPQELNPLFQGDNWLTRQASPRWTTNREQNKWKEKQTS